MKGKTAFAAKPLTIQLCMEWVCSPGQSGFVHSFNKRLDSLNIKAVAKGTAEYFNNLFLKTCICERGHAFFFRLF